MAMLRIWQLVAHSLAMCACLQCEIGKIANGSWQSLSSSSGCPTSLTGPGVLTLTLIPPSAGEKFYAASSSQC
jgi:hypothetical protein